MSPLPRFAAAAFFLLTLPAPAAPAACPPAPTSGPEVAGSKAVIKNGIAFAPKDAPPVVKRAIWAANRIAGKPYQFGGGHGSWVSPGYDCSGTVSWLLGSAGMLSEPRSSGDFASWGQPGAGKWITVYSRSGHVFAIVAGLRWDTTGPLGGEQGPLWQEKTRDLSRFTARHFPGL